MRCISVLAPVQSCESYQLINLSWNLRPKKAKYFPFPFLSS